MPVPRSLIVVCLVALLAATVLGSAQAQVGARAMGMGGAFVGLADDASATFYNPAALPFLQRSEVTYTHRVNNRGDNHAPLDFAALVVPFDEETTLGFSYLREMVNSFSMYDINMAGDVGFEWNQRQYVVSGGYRLDNQTGVGANARWSSNSTHRTELGQTVSSNADTDLALDVAGFRRVSQDITLGLMVANINEPQERLRVDGITVSEEDLKRTFSPGAAMKLPLGLTAAVQIQDLGDAVKRSLRVGAEMQFPARFFTYALRAGYYGDDSAVTLGAGLLYDDWSVDAALVDIGTDATWLLGVTGRF
jgi:hypothetical protein